MPAPDPDGVYISECYEGRIAVTHESYLWSNSNHNRFKRAVTILRRLQRGTWRCAWCWVDLQTWRRADAKYCCEGCRKRAARQRRLWGVGVGRTQRDRNSGAKTPQPLLRLATEALRAQSHTTHSQQPFGATNASITPSAAKAVSD